jgi:tetratricopeptide (TPR) repeat protein
MRIPVSAFSLLLALSGPSTPAAADDWSDCRYSVPEKRIAACTRIISRHDEGPERIAQAHTYRGIAYRNREDRDRAIADFTKAIELDPKRAAYNRGLVHAARNEHDQAIAQYDEAIRLDANDAAAYSARGSALNAKGERDKAVADFSEAIRLDPKLAVAYLNRGNAYYNKGDRELAVVDAMEVIRLGAQPSRRIRAARHRLRRQGRARPRHRGFHQGDRARPEIDHRLREPRHGPGKERRPRQGHGRFRQGHRDQSQGLPGL